MNEHLEHGSIWKNHSYVAKEKLQSGKYLYFYDLAKYQNWLKGKAAGTAPTSTLKKGKYALKDPNGAVKSDLQKQVSSSSSTLAQKTKQMNNNISKGTSVIGSILSKYSGSKTKSGAVASVATSDSSKKKGKSSSGSSKKKDKTSSGKKGKSGSSSSKSSAVKEAEKQAKAEAKAQKEAEKQAKAAQKEAEKQAKTSAALRKEQDKAHDNTLSSYKKILKVDDKNVTSIRAKDGEKITTEEAKDFETSLAKKYKDGATGYIVADDHTYRWTKANGKLKLEDIKTNEKVSLSTAISGATKVSEFKTSEKYDKKEKDTDEYEYMSNGHGKYIKVKKT